MYPHHQQQHQQQQQRPGEWKSHSPQAWPGHPPYHAQRGARAPQVHRPAPPPPVHYPPHHQHRQPQHQHPVHQSPYYHGSARSPAGPGPGPGPGPGLTRSAQHGHVQRLPALVSPSTHAAAASSPISPQAVTSSSPHGDLKSSGKLATPGAASASASTATAAADHAHAAASGNNAITSKPPRPYTEYTMFYQLEREFILHRILTTEEERERVPDLANKPALFENDPLMPARYRSLPLRADWYISGKSKKPTKRKHRKSHGKIGFLELTRMIAARWASVDVETRKYCKMMAAMELVKYKEDMESYNQYKEKLSAIGEIPEDMKERMLKKKRAQEKKGAIGKKAKEDGGSDASPGGKKPYEPPIILADRVNSSANGIAQVFRSNNGTAMRNARNGAMAGTMASAARAAPVKLEPMSHRSPHGESSNLDTDMEQFISSLVRSPDNPSNTKKITPERSGKRRRIFREKVPAAAATAIFAGGMPPLPPPASSSSEEMVVPLKDDDDDHLDGIKMAFSGIDESEMAREFSGNVAASSSPTGSTRKMTAAAPARAEAKPSFDYWDALVESPNH